MSQDEEEFGIEDDIVLAFVTVLSAIGFFALYIYYSAAFIEFYALMLLFSIAGLGFDPGQLHTELDDPRKVVVGAMGGYAASVLVVTATIASLTQYGLASQAASMYPFASTTLQVFWDGLSSNVLLTRLWYYLVTAAATMTPASVENVFFFGTCLNILAIAASGEEGDKGNHVANVAFAALIGVFFGMFHIYRIYGAENYWYNFLGNPIPVIGLATLGFIWGVLTLYVGLLPIIIVHWMWNMTSVFMGVAAIASIMGAGGLVLYGLKQHDYARLPGTRKGKRVKVNGNVQK